MKNYRVDIYEHNFVRGVYDLEVKRFRSSFKAAIYKSNKGKLDDQLMARLDELVNDKAEHLRCSIQHVARARKRQIVIMLDNADQRAADVRAGRVYNSSGDGKEIGMRSYLYLFDRIPFFNRNAQERYPHIHIKCSQYYRLVPN